ncbi:hypothetical protein QTP88_001002 [Uroleucon formosanum]
MSTLCAIKRVTTLEGLHLINYDPLSVTADKRAILQYNDFRERFRPDLLRYALPIHRKRDKNYVEQRWMVPRQILDVQESNDPLDGLANVRGLRADKFSSYANVTLQLLVLNKSLRGYQYSGMNEVDVSMFIKSIFKKCNLINDISNFKEVEIKLCGACNSKSIEQLNNNVLNLRLKNDGKTSHDFKELMNLQQSIIKKYLECKNFKIELDNYGNTNHITSMFSNCKIKSVPTAKNMLVISFNADAVDYNKCIPTRTAELQQPEVSFLTPNSNDYLVCKNVISYILRDHELENVINNNTLLAKIWNKCDSRSDDTIIISYKKNQEFNTLDMPIEIEGSTLMFTDNERELSGIEVLNKESLLTNSENYIIDSNVENFNLDLVVKKNVCSNIFDNVINKSKTSVTQFAMKMITQTFLVL